MGARLDASRAGSNRPGGNGAVTVTAPFFAAYSPTRLRMLPSGSLNQATFIP